MGKLGDYLREVREGKKLTLQDVSKATAVRRHFLELLEQGRYAELPSYVHVHGFLSQYSKFLGLDFQNAIKPLLDEECQKETFGKTKEEIELENETKLSSPKFSTAQVISAVVVIAVIALVGYAFYTNGFSSKRAAARASAAAQPQQREYSTEPPAVVAATPIPEIPEVLPVVADNKTETPAATSPNNDADNRTTAVARLDNTSVSENRPNNTADNRTAQPATGTFQTVILNFSAECWYRFMADNDNTTSIDLIAPAGTSRSVRFKNFFRLDIGNAGGISMQHNGKNYTGFGAPSQPILNLYFRVDGSGTLQQSRTQPALSN
jgi:cytoskeletal protein RodZ